MSEFDDLEKELSALKPIQPSVHFVSRVEEALGEAGTIAVRRLDEREKRVEQIPKKSLFTTVFTLPVILGSTAFASLLFIAYISFSVLSEQREANNLPNVATQVMYSLHGVSLAGGVTFRHARQDAESNNMSFQKWMSVVINLMSSAQGTVHLWLKHFGIHRYACFRPFWRKPISLI